MLLVQRELLLSQINLIIQMVTLFRATVSDKRKFYLSHLILLLGVETSPFQCVSIDFVSKIVLSIVLDNLKVDRVEEI